MKFLPISIIIEITIYINRIKNTKLKNNISSCEMLNDFLKY